MTHDETMAIYKVIEDIQGAVIRSLNHRSGFDHMDTIQRTYEELMQGWIADLRRIVEAQAAAKETA